VFYWSFVIKFFFQNLRPLPSPPKPFPSSLCSGNLCLNTKLISGFVRSCFVDELQPHGRDERVVFNVGRTSGRRRILHGIRSLHAGNIDEILGRNLITFELLMLEISIFMIKELCKKFIFNIKLLNTHLWQMLDKNVSRNT